MEVFGFTPKKSFQTDEKVLSESTQQMMAKYSVFNEGNVADVSHWRNPPTANQQVKKVKAFHDMQGNEINNRTKLELEALKLRDLGSRRISDWAGKLPDKVQLGTVQPSNKDFYNRLTKKQRSTSIVDEVFLKDQKMISKIAERRVDVEKTEQMVRLAKMKLKSSQNRKDKRNRKLKK